MISRIKAIIQSMDLAPILNSVFLVLEESIIGQSKIFLVFIFFDLGGMKKSKSLWDITTIIINTKQAPIMPCIGSGLTLVSLLYY